MSIDPKLMEMFGKAGIDMGAASKAVGGGGGPTGPPQPGQEEQLPPEEGLEDPDADPANTDTESEIFRAICEGSEFVDNEGNLVADFSFLPPELRDQFREVLLKGIGTGQEQELTSVG